MREFAIYRLPHGDYATMVQQTEGHPAALKSLRELNGKSGFVIAPFEVRDDQPILLIRPDSVERVDIPLIEESISDSKEREVRDEERSSYATDFDACLENLKQGRFKKIVLARCAKHEIDKAVSPMTLFFRACNLYPRMFITLVQTEQSGCWLMATPEILLAGKDKAWQTIALAGTMKLEGEQLAYDTPQKDVPIFWTTKNIQEQRYVATYIAACLKQFSDDIHEEGPTTVRAANLVHLRSDFNFTLPDSGCIGDLLEQLHPTPAVCGLPKQETFDFIVGHEHTPRYYYSGFTGRLDPEQGTHLYVSLRCMHINDSYCDLYAGGGLLKDSVEEQEWMETEAKLETMRSLWK